MLRAFANDMAQRILSANRMQPRRDLFQFVSGLKIEEGGRVLDFGCGTGLFAPTLAKKCGLIYTGYDIDEEFISYAKRLYPFGDFFSSRRDVESTRPFDLVTANCCFHHIPDAEALLETAFIRGLLKPGGTFLFIDILKVENDPSPLHRWFMKLEEGGFVRTQSQYAGLLSRSFVIKSTVIRRSVLFSLNFNSCPIYNDLVFMECQINNFFKPYIEE